MIGLRRHPFTRALAGLLVAALTAAMAPQEAWASRGLEPSTVTIHADGIGSVRALTDESGAITDTYTYTAFGELLSHVGMDPQPYAFAGEPYDRNSHLDYLRARWLDVTSGRFISGDTFAGHDEDPLSLHKYLYVSARPLDLVDPTGHENLPTMTQVAASVATIAARAVPTISSAIFTVASILAPAEAIGPATLTMEFSVIGAAAASGYQLVHLPWFKRLLQSLAGMGRLPLGNTFSSYFGQYVLRNAAKEAEVVVKDGQIITSGARIKGSVVIDWLTDLIVYECKLTSKAIKAYQAEQFARFAARNNRVLSYVFAIRPTPDELARLQAIVQRVSAEEAKQIPLYIGYVF